MAAVNSVAMVLSQFHTRCNCVDIQSVMQAAIHFCIILKKGVDVRGHKSVFGPTQTHFSPSATIIINLKGNIEHENNKIDCNQSNSRLPASCIYFVVLLTTYCSFRSVTFPVTRKT